MPRAAVCLFPHMTAHLQADDRPVGNPDPSPPVDPRPDQEAPSDRDEASNISTSERSESFTHALQKLQACLYTPCTLSDDLVAQIAPVNLGCSIQRSCPLSTSAVL